MFGNRSVLSVESVFNRRFVGHPTQQCNWSHQVSPPSKS